MAQRGAVVAATVVGVLSGFYIYDEPLKKLAEEGKAAYVVARSFNTCLLTSLDTGLRRSVPRKRRKRWTRARRRARRLPRMTLSRRPRHCQCRLRRK